MKKNRWRKVWMSALVTGLLFSVAPDGKAQALPKRTLLAVSKVDHTLAIVDPESLKVLARVPVGADPHEVLAAPDGKTAYVSNTGYGSFHELNIIDLEAQKALPSFDTAPLFGPHGLAFAGGKLWFTAQGSKAVGRYDPQSGKMDWAMGTGQNTTHMLHVTDDAKQVYTTNVESGTVSIFENKLLPPTVPPTGVLPPGAQPRLDWVQTLVPVGKGAEGFDVAPDGKELWTATPDGKLYIVDMDGRKLATTLEANLPGAHRLQFSPDGGRVLVVSVRTGELAVFDARTRKEIKRLQIGRGAAMLMDPVGNRAFVSCTPDHYIAVIDLEKLEVSGRLEIGGRPDGLAWAVRPE
ncbi:YncE family protein [Paraflavisolibacter sp. H34]|uniref:YncE family protein n=1 Tax=Huijunlia imazamoxiresistens TaxID=3127457 RepID=UPI0030196C70